jgi:hypothetical protein
MLATMSWVDRFEQTLAQPAADRGPRLPLAIIGDQPIAFGRSVELVFDVGLLKRAV